MSQFKDDIVAAETVYFWFAANLTTGAAGDGATPLYDVRLAGAASSAAPTASGTPTLLSHANYTDGLHEIAIDTTGYANGEYAVFCTLTISTVNPAGFVGSFRVRTANRIDAIKAKTDNLPADPADASDIAARTLPSAQYATAAAQATLQTSVDDIPTNAELATSQAAADDATLAAIAAIPAAPTAASIADQVWDEVLSGHLTAGSTGAALNAAGAAGDPWSTALPGAYGAGTAGKIVGDNIDAKISDVPTGIENADALLDRNMATGTDSGSATVRTPRQALRFLRNKWAPDGGGNISVKKENDSDESWKFVPTTTPGADPITASDPEGP